VGPWWRRSERKHDWLRASVHLLLGGAFAILAVLVGAGLWSRHQEVLKSGQSGAENLALILSDHLARTIGSIDTTLIQLALHSARVGGPDAPAELWDPILDATFRQLPGVGSLSVTNAAGVITHSTLRQLVGQPRGDFFLFRKLSADPESAIAADAPLRGAASGQVLMPLGRRLVSPDGQFQGIVVGTFVAERLRDFYRSVDVGDGGIIFVLHPNGLVIVREPADPGDQTAQSREILREQRDGADAGYRRRSFAPGGASFLIAHRRIARPELVVAVALAERAVLAAWWRDVFISSGIVGAFGMVLLFAGLRMTHEIRARSEADTLLLTQAQTLTATVAQRDEANAALRLSQARFQAVLDHAPLTVAVRDLAGRYVLVNRAFEHQFATTAAQALGKTPHELFAKELADFHLGADGELMATGTPVQREETIPGSPGPRTMLSVTFALRNAADAVELIGTVAADVTDRRHAELRLAHGQKMEAIGQLTGGVAHDFNNLLTAIVLNADLMADALVAEPRLRPLAEMTRDAAERGAELTRRLLAFSRQQLLEPQPTDANQLIDGMEQLMRRTLGAHITIRLDLAADLWPAMVDRGQLETAVLNLAVNARDAMPGGGRLTIETANAALDATYADMVGEVQPGDYVMVAVGDTGTGMPPGVAERAFEPFFTTKEIGKGTGLGLSMVYGFVKQSGGHVKIYSEVGIGTVVRLYIPRSSVGKEAGDPTAAEPEALPGGSESVLFVEDEPLVRASTQAQLMSLGYRVVAAVNATDALDHVHAGLIPDLLFTDIVMPGGMNGLALAEQLQRELPGLKVLYTSGYTHGVVSADDGEPIPAGHLLGKPFRRRDLAAKIREVLDAAHAMPTQMSS
jgi:PAS domain S-box-containing protein